MNALRKRTSQHALQGTASNLQICNLLDPSIPTTEQGLNFEITL